MKTFLLAGFPSPWRWLRRRAYRKWYANKYPTKAKVKPGSRQAQLSPEHKIKWGLL